MFFEHLQLLFLELSPKRPQFLLSYLLSCPQLIHPLRRIFPRIGCLEFLQVEVLQFRQQIFVLMRAFSEIDIDVFDEVQLCLAAVIILLKAII